MIPSSYSGGLRFCLLLMLLCSSAAFSQTKVVVIPLAGDTEESNWRGPWQSGTTYQKSDVVEDGGSSYLSLQDHNSDLTNIPPAVDFWALLAASGAQGPTGSQGPAGQQGETGLTGPQGIAGVQGVAGPVGPKGDQGDVGPAGPQGDPGPTPPLCVGAYKALQYDGANLICVELDDSGLSGGMSQGFETIDDWGDAWDGLERSPRNWSQANATCQSAGGRLPTATELYRVSGNANGDLGTLALTEYLWTLIRRSGGSAQDHYALRLSDGVSTWYQDTVVRPYRCIWPANNEQTFTANRCYGPADNACFNVTSEGARYNIDKFDRPALSSYGATQECAFYNAHLPTANALTETIQAGLPNGSNAQLSTSDHVGYNGTNFLLSTVRWTGVNTAFNDLYPTDASWAYNRVTDTRPFRCAGIDAAYTPHSGAVADAWTEPGLRLTSTTSDSASTGSYLDAIDACRSQGGHLPYQRDLFELVSAGLPNGSDDWLWTADTQRGDASPAQTGAIKWVGTDTGFNDNWSQYATWVNRNTAVYKHRCVFYPIDETYSGPATCNGSCVSDTRNNGVDTTIWTDAFDRSAAGYGDAVRACYAEGGHLPSHRDMAELIRSGIPNGSNTFLWTSDHTRFDLTRLVRWSGVNTSWGDIDGTDSADGARNDTLRPYRCVWSNELNW